ncbi:HAD hydrolase-like protein [Paenibacillus caseinilyticus]|uniref:Haloacid dehalogenase n=1 Tax=Paenibacillus mucilaginosus K02 TaxID=997761 RepID=I0BUU8_9BACL|nr:HAD hydrolase-like protein [Paenibacillus mucilaginosus]AFH66145.1 haloacid dehalogenase [Paenibacillus mucilaginosus K02]
MQTLLVFNFNGTLVSTRDLAIRIYNGIAADKGYRVIHPEDVAWLRSISIKDRCRHLGVPLYLLPVIGVAIKHRYQQEISRLPAVEGIPEMLRALKSEGYVLRLMTSNSRSVTGLFLEANGIDLFDAIHYAHNPFSKERGLTSFLKQSRAAYQEIYYVGDELRDMRAGRKAGVRTIAAAWGYDSVELLRQGEPSHIVHKPSDLIDAVQRFG